MSSPGDTGAHGDGRRAAHGEADAATTTSLPAAGTPEAGGPYPRSGMPGRAGTATVPDRPAGRPEVVAPVPPATPRGAFADAPGGLPPRPGAGHAAPAGTNRPGAAPAGRARATRPARAAQLSLRKINVWSVFKLSCLLSIILWLIWMIAVGVLYGVLQGAGVISSINDAVGTLQGGSATFALHATTVFGVAAIIGAVNIVLFIALATLLTVIYNLSAGLLGGVDVTLSERD